MIELFDDNNKLERVFSTRKDARIARKVSFSLIIIAGQRIIRKVGEGIAKTASF